MNKEKLVSAGINYDEGIHRFSGKAEIYEKYIRRLFEQNPMEELKSQIDEKNYENAFRLAHSLKGTTGSLSVNKLYDKMCALVEVLSKTPQDEKVTVLFEEACDLYETAGTAVREAVE